MKSKLKILAVALFASTAAVAMAQAPNRAQSFADQFRQMQTLSANTASTYAYKPAPVVGARAQDPVAGESFHDRFADMQAAGYTIVANGIQRTNPPVSIFKTGTTIRGDNPHWACER